MRGGGFPRETGGGYGGIPHQYGSSSGGGHGQMVINMKTTVTTSGGSHNGLVVHSAVQSAASPSTSLHGGSSWMSPYSPDPPRRLDDRLDMIRSNTSLHRSSPLPIQMVPSTSRETLISTGGRKERAPSPPPSPVYSFKGRDSPPDEFIQPTKLVLNVFRPKTQEPLWQSPISRSQVSIPTDSSQGGIQLSKKNALLNDAVTTTTTVEVFRAPLEPETPMISLTSSPFGGNPLLVRAHGPPYEQWKSQSRQSLIGEDGMRDGQKGVQWKERLIEETRFRDTSSDYDEIEPLTSNGGEVQYIHHDYRPKKQSFQPVTHPMIMSSSREDLRSQPPPYPAPLSPLYIVPDRRSQSRNSFSPAQYSRRSQNGERERREDRGGYNVEQRENDMNGHRERYQRRSKSSNRDDPSSSSVRSIRHRSMSPASRRSHNTFGGSQEFVLPLHSPIGSTLMLASPDPNELPGRPASARSQEIFALYQTRDAYNRIVDQL